MSRRQEERESGEKAREKGAVVGGPTVVRASPRALAALRPATTPERQSTESDLVRAHSHTAAIESCLDRHSGQRGSVVCG